MYSLPDTGKVVEQRLTKGIVVREKLSLRMGPSGLIFFKSEKELSMIRQSE